MVCIYCAGATQVVNSRHQKRSNQVWRRRQCGTCGAIFTSYETADLSSALAVADDTGRLSPFMKERLFLSVYKSCQHRKSAITDAKALTDTAVSQILHHAVGGLITPKHIATTCLAILQKFDTAAAVQYEAYHIQTLHSPNTTTD